MRPLDGLDFVEKVVVYSPSGLRAQQHTRNRLQRSDEVSRPTVQRRKWTRKTRCFSSTLRDRPANPRAWCTCMAATWSAPPIIWRTFYDVGDRDIFWCTSDIGWVVGHSYIVYAPLCAGATTLFREGAIDYPNPESRGRSWNATASPRCSLRRPLCACSCVTGRAIRRSMTSPLCGVIACAGEPLNPEAWRWAQTHLAGDGKWGYVVDNWWQTELGGPALGHAANHGDASGQSGRRRCQGSEADVVDEQGKPVPPGVGGRLVLKRPFPTCCARCGEIRRATSAIGNRFPVAT